MCKWQIKYIYLVSFIFLVLDNHNGCRSVPRPPTPWDYSILPHALDMIR